MGRSRQTTGCVIVCVYVCKKFSCAFITGVSAITLPRVAEKDEGRELKLLTPMDVKLATLATIEEKHKKNTIPVLEAQGVVILLESEDQLIVRAKALVLTETFPADKGKQGTDAGECILKIEKQTGYFVTTSLQDEDDEPED